MVMHAYKNAPAYRAGASSGQCPLAGYAHFDGRENLKQEVNDG